MNNLEAKKYLENAILIALIIYLINVFETKFWIKIKN